MSLSCEKGPGTDIRNRKGPSCVSRDGGEGSEKEKLETQRRLAFIEKGLAFIEIQRRDHKENFIITPISLLLWTRHCARHFVCISPRKSEKSSLAKFFFFFRKVKPSKMKLFAINGYWALTPCQVHSLMFCLLSDSPLTTIHWYGSESGCYHCLHVADEGTRAKGV